MTAPAEIMGRFVDARDRATQRLAAGETTAWLAERGIDAAALRVFARHCEHATDELGTSVAASFSAGFLTALELATPDEDAR